MADVVGSQDRLAELLGCLCLCVCVELEWQKRAEVKGVWLSLQVRGSQAKPVVLFKHNSCGPKICSDQMGAGEGQLQGQPGVDVSIFYMQMREKWFLKFLNSTTTCTLCTLVIIYSMGKG